MHETTIGKPSAPTPSFDPPRPEQVHEHLQANHPQPMPMWQRAAPLGILGIAVVAMLVIHHPVAGVLPWLALGALAVAGMIRLRTSRNLEASVTRVGEQVMLRRLPLAIREAWALIPKLVRHGSLHGRTAAILGHSLDDLGQHEAALVCYDHLLSGLPEQSPASLHVQVTRTVCALRTDRLIEADEALRKLRGAIDPYRQTSIGAAYRFAELLQHVRTHHYADALEMEGNLLDELRPLGVEAGFGHALMALCCRHAQSDNQAKADSQHASAETWWNRARCLLPRQTLFHSYPELRSLE